MARYRQAACVLQHAGRYCSEGACAVVVGHHPTDQVIGAHIGPGGRNWDRVQLAGPEVGQVSILVAENSVIFPAHAEIQRELRAEFVVILNKGVLVGQAIAVDHALLRPSYAEDATVDVAWASNQEVIKRTHQKPTAFETLIDDVPLV